MAEGGKVRHLADEIRRAMWIIEEVEYLMPPGFKTTKRFIGKALESLDEVFQDLDIADWKEKHGSTKQGD